MLIRIPFAPLNLLAGSDLDAFRRWARLIQASGMAAVYTNAGVDYPPLNLYLFGGAAWLADHLAAFSGTSNQWLTILIKLPPMLADILTAWLVARALRSRSATASIVAASAYVFNPAIWYVSSYWGQTDSTYTLFLVFAVLALERGAMISAWSSWTLGIFTKLQSIALAPLLVVITLQKRGWRGVLAALGASSALAAILSAPWLLTERANDVIQVYLNQPSESPRVSVSAYNLWYLLFAARVHNVSAELHPFDLPLTYQTLVIALFGVYALFITVTCLRRERIALGAAALSLGLFVLPTQIHERYMFSTLALLLVAMGLDSRLWIAFAILSATFFFNLITIAPFTPRLGINLVAVEPTTIKIIVLKIFSLIAAALNLIILLWMTGNLARPEMRGENES